MGSGQHLSYINATFLVMTALLNAAAKPPGDIAPSLLTGNNYSVVWWLGRLDGDSAQLL